jgi:hypothetical protein
VDKRIARRADSHCQVPRRPPEKNIFIFEKRRRTYCHATAALITMNWLTVFGTLCVSMPATTTGAGTMIRYSCDLCGRELDAKSDLRYVVKLEVYASFDPAAADEEDDDRDHLQEIQEILERLEDADDEQIGDDVYQQQRYDLCADCRKRFMKNPLGREAAKAFGFSTN